MRTEQEILSTAVPGTSAFINPTKTETLEEFQITVDLVRSLASQGLLTIIKEAQDYETGHRYIRAIMVRWPELRSI